MLKGLALLQIFRIITVSTLSLQRIQIFKNNKVCTLSHFCILLRLYQIVKKNNKVHFQGTIEAKHLNFLKLAVSYCIRHPSLQSQYKSAPKNRTSCKYTEECMFRPGYVYSTVYPLQYIQYTCTRTTGMACQLGAIYGVESKSNLNFVISANR